MLTKRGHERHCPYLRLITYWDNPDDSDGEWPVQAVLAMRGPPNRRFVQLQWAEPEDDTDTSSWEHADLVAEDGTARAGDGSWKYGWQPIACCANLRNTLIATWYQNHRDIDPRGSIEVEGELRCVHCNYITVDDHEMTRHARRCDFKPVKRPRDSVAGRMATAAWEAELVGKYPAVKVHDAQTGETVASALNRRRAQPALAGFFDDSTDSCVRCLFQLVLAALLRMVEMTGIVLSAEKLHRGKAGYKATATILSSPPRRTADIRWNWSRGVVVSLGRELHIDKLKLFDTQKRIDQ